jgi:hypothetical protein
MVQDERKDPDVITNDEQAAKQFAGELPLPIEPEEEVEEEDAEGNKRKVKRKKSK